MTEKVVYMEDLDYHLSDKTLEGDVEEMETQLGFKQKKTQPARKKTKKEKDAEKAKAKVVDGVDEDIEMK